MRPTKAIPMTDTQIDQPRQAAVNCSHVLCCSHLLLHRRFRPSSSIMPNLFAAGVIARAADFSYHASAATSFWEAVGHDPLCLVAILSMIISAPSPRLVSIASANTCVICSGRHISSMSRTKNAASQQHAGFMLPCMQLCTFSAVLYDSNVNK